MPDTSSTRSEIFSDVLPSGTTLLGGAFELHEVLGRGGFGITYRATNRRRERDVAIKELFTFGCTRDGKNVVALAENAAIFRQARARFQEQACDLAPLRHANIVRVYELIEENDTLYLVMELLRGQTLLEIVKKRGFLPEDKAIALIETLSGALETVHNLGLLHLDIKPENVWQTPDNRLVLMDFDLVQKRARETDLRTRPLGETFRSGTPGYAPLEQYSNSAPFARATDIYALGATLYHLVVGNAPPSPLENTTDDAPPIPESLSKNLRETLRRALQPQAENRPQSVREFLDLLEGRAPIEKPDASFQNATSSTRSPTKVLSQQGVAQIMASQMNASQMSASQNTVAQNAALASSTTLQSAATSNWQNTNVSAPTQAPIASVYVAASVLEENLKKRVWRVAIEENQLHDLRWPALCPCCGESCAINSMSFFEIGKGSRAWKVPHCAICATHTDATRTASFVTIWGMVGGTLISMIGLVMKSLLLGPLGIVVYFSAMSFGLLKTADTDGRIKPECVDNKVSVSCLGTRLKNGRSLVVFEFRRPDYADAFRQANNAVWG